MAVLWDVAPSNVADTDRCFRAAYCPDDEGTSYHLRRISEYLTMQLHRRQPSSA